MKMRFSACAADAPSSKAKVMVARRDRMWAPAVLGPGSVHRDNASETVKAALTPSDAGCGALDLPGALTRRGLGPLSRP